MLYPANKLIQIESGKDYTNEELYSIHCTKTNTGVVTVKTLNTTIDFPPYSFICGATYHIYITELVFEENTTSFIGYGFKK